MRRHLVGLIAALMMAHGSAALLAADGMQSFTPRLSDEQVAALRYTYDRSIAPRGQEKPTFEAFAQTMIDRALSGVVETYRLAQKRSAADDVAKIDVAVCQKLDTATKELLAKALDGRAFCGVSAPLDVAVAVEATR